MSFSQCDLQLRQDGEERVRQMKQCPFCAETIQKAAIKCRFCGERLPSDEADDAALLQNLPPVQDEHPSTPPVQPARRKTNWLRVSLVILGIIAVYWATMLWSMKNKPSNQTASTPKKTFTIPATDEAKTQRGIVLLKELHKSFLDSDYAMEHFRQKVMSVTDELIAITDATPTKDSREELLLNALQPYQEAGLRSGKDEEATALAVAGGIRRAGLERILDGSLTQKQRENLLLVWPEHKALIMQSK